MAIALLTDFGTRDYFVAAMKGVILSINGNAAVVDVTHEVGAQDVRAAAFVLASCCGEFPGGTIFVAVVDPGVGSRRRAIAAEMDGRVFIAPDNGILSLVFAEREPERVHEISKERFFRQPVSSTFHGRDVYAPAAAWVSRGTDLSELGPRVEDIVRLPACEPHRTDGGVIEGEILHVDRFGNLVTNVKSVDFPDRFAMHIGGRVIDRLVQFYAEAEPGELFAIAGSAGFIEISANRGSAAELLKAGPGQRFIVEPPKPAL